MLFARHYLKLQKVNAMMKELSIFIIAIAIFALAITAALYLEHLMTLPQCQEDVVLVGIGDFEHGRWTSYECGPTVDDYIGE